MERTITKPLDQTQIAQKESTQAQLKKYKFEVPMESGKIS